MEYEIYWDDLKEEVKTRLKSDGFIWNENMDLVPIFIISQDSIEDNSNE